MKHRLFCHMLLSLGLGLIGQGCQKRKETLGGMPVFRRDPMDFLKSEAASFPPFFSLPKVKSLIQRNQLKELSRYVNEAINIEPRNASLHLLNALVYESLLEGGQEDRRELIDIAYRTAMDLDPSLWLPHYFRGLNALKMAKYKEAQKYLADAHGLSPKNSDITYAMAYASYYSYDIPVAAAFIEKTMELCPEKPLFIRSAAMIYAAAGEQSKANTYLDKYQNCVGKSETDSNVMKVRLGQWAEVHKRIQLTGVRGEATGLREGKEFETYLSKKEKDTADPSNISIVFDTTLISYSEQENQSRGQNIFNSLQVVLGGANDNSGTINGTPQWNTSFKKETIGNLATATQSGTILNYGITPFAMLYSLNIANSGRSTVEVLSRATLSTTLGHSAYFLQGAQYTGASTANLTGASTSSVDAGMRIEIRPLSLSDTGEVVVEVTLIGSDFINLPNAGLGISNQLIQVQRTKVSTTTKAQIGQTIMIGGIQTRQRNKSKGGFPVLQDLPLVQYFTSNYQSSDNLASAVFLMTPRLGGNAPESMKIREKNALSMGRQLQKRGLMSIGQHPNAYYILRTFEKNGMFAHYFRSGDLPSPTRNHDATPLWKKILSWISW